MIAAVDTGQDPRNRLRKLLHIAFTAVTRGTDGGGSTELTLQAHASDPLVAATLERVTRRRLNQLTELYETLGLHGARARDRSLLAYTAYLGHLQVARATPNLLPRGRAFGAHVDQIIDTLVRTG